MDDNINLDRRHIIGICREIGKRKLNIQFETPNGLHVGSLDEEVVDAMIEAGWVRGSIAIESGSDFMRNTIIRKHLSREKIMEVVRLARRYKDLYLRAFFLMGMPEETPQTLMETYQMIEELDVDEVSLTNVMPFPGTALFNQALKDGLFSQEIDLDNLWKQEGFHYHNNRTFYIKPYKMEIAQLSEFREKLELLIENKKRKKQGKRQYEP